MRRFVPLTLAAALALPLVAAGGAEEVEPLFTDAAGDANFINGQGSDMGLENSGPMQMPGADIQSVAFESDADAGTLKVHIGLDGPFDTSSADVVIRVTGNIGDCPMMFAAERRAVEGITGYWRFTDSDICGYDPAAESILGTYNSLDGVIVESTETGVTITVDRAAAEGFVADLMKPGTVISGLGAHSRTILVAATAPVIDQVFVAEDVTYELGS